MNRQKVRPGLEYIAVPSPTLPPATTTNAWLLEEHTILDPAAKNTKTRDVLYELLQDNPPKRIFLTHHHNDHIGGILELKKIFPDVNIYGPSDKRIPANIIVNDGENVKLNSLHESFKVIDVKGHTNSHVAYYFKNKLYVVFYPLNSIYN